MTIREILHGLGGHQEVARKLGLKRSAPSMWVSRNAIPAEHHLAVWRLALAAGLAWEPPGAAELRGLLNERCALVTRAAAHEADASVGQAAA